MLRRTKKYVFKPQHRERLKKRYVDLLKRNGVSPKAKGIHDFYFDYKIKEKTILISGLGRSVRGSMQYVLNELNNNPEYEDYEIFVRTDPSLTEEEVQGYIEKNNWKRTSIVSASKEFDKKMEACKYLVTESYFPYEWIKKQGQVMIDLWHGTPLKKLGVLKEGDKCHKAAIQQKNFLCSDYLMYPNDFTRDMMWESYRITPLLNAKALYMGYPRTAGILKTVEAGTEEIRAELAPSGECIYAYMPTFRGYLSDEETIAKEKEFLDYLDQNLKDDQILYINLHHHIKEGLNTDSYKHIEKFPPFIDSYSLLAASDALISDYSSVFFDYLVLRKQIILHIDDLETYQSYQGLNLNIEDLPFDLARSKEEVIEMLNRGKSYDDSEMFNMMCSNDAADNPEKFCRLFLGDEKGLKLEEIPGNDKAKVLLYDESLAVGKDTQRLFDITDNYNKKDYEFYIGCDELKVKKNMDGAYPKLHDNLVIDFKDKVRYSAIGSPLLRLYKDKKVTFKQAIKFLHYEYAILSKRGYGDVVFDVACVYDVTKPETVMGIALSEAREKILFISDRMEAEIKDKNRFLIDAIRFSVQYCNYIVVDNREKEDSIKNIVRFIDRFKIIEMENTEDVIKLIEKLPKERK